MIRKLMIASICTACVLSVTPSEAKQPMHQGKRDVKSMDYTKRQMVMRKKENKEANSNVDRLIRNRR